MVDETKYLDRGISETERGKSLAPYQQPVSRPLAKAPQSIKLKEAKKSWDRIVTVRTHNKSKSSLADKTVDRFFQTTLGKSVINSIDKMFFDSKTGKVKSVVILHFVDKLPPNAKDAGGCFTPEEPDQEEYDVYIKNVSEEFSNSRATELYSEYPGTKKWCNITFFHKAPESIMSHSLFHELLHVWFINRYKDDKDVVYPTGHGDQMNCEFEKEKFWKLIKSHIKGLDRIESKFKP